jgi:hypothetical protein
MAIANITGNILTDSGVSTSSLVSGSGTTNYLPKFTAASTLGNSLIQDDGSKVSISSANTTIVLDTTSTSFDASLRLNNNSSATTWGILQAGPGAISGGGMNMYTTGAYPFTLGTNGTERMRITSTGNVGIGTSNPTFGKVQINSDSQDAFALCTATNANQQLVLGYNLGSNYGRIQSVNQGTSYTSLYLNKDGGAVYAGSVRLDTLSDERVKDNIQPIEGALNKVLSITGKKFHLKDEEEGKLRYGFIAQELEGILDEFVIQTDITFKDGDNEVENVKSIENWASSWSALLVEAIKEQQAIIQELSVKVSALENKS